MTAAKLEQQIRKKGSFLCIGLDTDPERIPPHLQDEEDPVFAFNKAIIDATHHLCVAYKPNTAFYEAGGSAGWRSLERTMAYLNREYPDHFSIADAKRGDIGNTSTRYAQAFFGAMDFDAVTVAPYMGRDSVEPFLAFRDKFVILLALTSNPGAFDFQTAGDGSPGAGPNAVTDKSNARTPELFEKVLAKSLEYAGSDRLMFVVGATKAEYLARVRKVVPDHFLLVPGVGAQGGSLHDVCRYGMNERVGLLVNSSRGIIYASNGVDFARQAAARASGIQAEMSAILSEP